MRQWVKLHTKILTEPKVLRLPDRLFRTCINLIALAGYLDEDGRLGPTEDVALHLRLSVKKTGAALNDLSTVCIVVAQENVWFLKNWDEYNGRAPSDSKEKVLERVTKHRGKQVKTTTRNAVTDSLQRDGNEPRVDKNREDKNREEQNTGTGVPTPDPVKELAAVFEQAAGIKMPTPSTDKGRKQVGVLWWNPLREMLNTANGKAPELLRQTVRRMRADKLTIGDPHSCAKVFASLYGETVADAPAPKLGTGYS